MSEDKPERPRDVIKTEPREDAVPMAEPMPKERPIDVMDTEERAGDSP